MNATLGIDIDPAGTPQLVTPAGSFALDAEQAALLLTDLASAVALSLEANAQAASAAASGDSHSRPVTKRSKWHRSKSRNGYELRLKGVEGFVWREAQNKWFAELNGEQLNTAPISTKTDAYRIVEAAVESQRATDA